MYSIDTLLVENFDEIALTVKEIEAILCFCIFGKNSKNSKWVEDTLRVKNFNEIALSLTVKEIAYILRFCIFGENSKIQNGRHFWKFFQKWA